MSGNQSLFGTDGIRARVGEWPITPEQVLKLGWACGRVLGVQGASHLRVVIGKDTRLSGYLLESAMEAGLSAAGVDTMLLGPMPTPGIAYLTRALRADAGVVISASHNPFDDNGIKLFGSDGCKLPDELEAEIEEEVAKPLVTVEPAQLGKARRIDDASGRYIEFCKHTFPQELSLEGFHLVVDCAHGATYRTAPQVFRELGAEVTEVATSPDGYNINEGVGSLHPESAVGEVITHRAHVGIAFDGDGDRVIFADASGKEVDGDGLLYLIALEMQRRGELQGGVVGTVMSNLGLERALERANIPFARARVGDRFVYQQLLEHGWVLGGEPSGHVICLTHNSTGDGIISALLVLAILARSGATSLDEVGLDQLCLYPQAHTTVRIADHREVADVARVMEAVHAAEAELAPEGRVVVRNAGTEPKVRVMVESQKAERAHSLAEWLAEVIRTEMTIA